jgi:putative ABC transport system permease protein
VERWIEATITADLYLTPGSRPAVGPSAHFADDAVVAVIASVPGVAAVDPYRQIPIEADGQLLLVSSRDARIVRDRSGMQFEHGDPNAILDRLAKGDGVVISEVLARRLGARAGESLRLPTPDGPASFPILAVFYDYATDGGRVLMDRSVFVRYWRDRGVTAAAVYVGEEADPERVRAAIDAALAPSYRVAITSNRALKREVLEVFDQTFAITRALEWVAMAVAALGVANTVLAIVLERRREVGVLRALGATRAQVGGIVLCEAGLIGLLGSALGVAVGFAVSLVLIRVVNLQSFGWTIGFSWGVTEVIGAALLAFVAAVAAGWFPARHAAGLPFVEVLTDE